ncbi:MAG TPA: cyanophycin synthetase, partial [Thermodesulfobacteriota bacterium]|nr:cyanophycin synthetase [Thermodesulfobacteriota bacterium]
MSAAAALGIPPASIAQGITRLDRVPGRLERVAGGDGIGVFVDYAHTPDALERALSTLDRIRSGRVIVVFGCGGDRDRGKRPVMGETAARKSDLALITSDNPRTEDPLAIIDEVEKGARAAGRKKIERRDLSAADAESGYAVIPDRREAIRA